MGSWVSGDPAVSPGLAARPPRPGFILCEARPCSELGREPTGQMEFLPSPLPPRRPGRERGYRGLLSVVRSLFLTSGAQGYDRT